MQISHKQSAQQAFLWGAGFNLLRDLLQFGAMLIMVRLLPPEDYGSAALAQSIMGLIAVFSFGSFVQHAYQLRDPGEVDWQAHFSAAFVLNTILFCITLVFAYTLSFSERYQAAAWPLAGQSTVLLIEIAGSLRHAMLECHHDWKRFRVLLGLGTILGLGAGLLIACLGGGVWALVVQSPLFGLPATVDLFWGGKWRPTWSWSWARYRETAFFAFNRMGSTALIRGRQTVEQTVMSGAYDFAALGMFTRAIGLATLLAGRIGTLTVGTLYPVITRAEPGSARFQRMGALALRGVGWTTIPAAGYLALYASDVVELLYGAKWQPVADLLPLSVVGVAMGGITTALSRLLLANNVMRASLLLDAGSASLGIGLAFCLVQMGVKWYLAALVAQGLIVGGMTAGVLIRSRGLTLRSFLVALVPAAYSAFIAAMAVWVCRNHYTILDLLPLPLVMDTFIFATIYLTVLRLCTPIPMQNLLNVVPGGRYLLRILKL